MCEARLGPRFAGSPPWRRFALSIVLAVTGLACGDDPPSDDRYATAGATVQTLFEAYRIADLSQQEVRERMQARGRFNLSDPESFQGCFRDYGGPQDESLAGYVFGRLAAAKDELRYYLPPNEPGRVEVHTSSDAEDDDPVVLLEVEGQWKISLSESVPAQVRQQLHGVFMRAKQRALREGHPD